MAGRHVAAADPGVADGVNIDRGRVTNQAVAATFGLAHVPLSERPEGALTRSSIARRKMHARGRARTLPAIADRRLQDPDFQRP